MHNEDDSSEASTSEQQPSTSATAQASTSSQDQPQPSSAQAPESSGAAEAPPPPYASIDLGATAAAAAAAPGIQAWPVFYKFLKIAISCSWSRPKIAAGSCVCDLVAATDESSRFVSGLLPLLHSSLSIATETSFGGDFPVPPPYSVATSLPTYDEAEKAKAAAMAACTAEVMPRVR